jgi:hypothetical protein
MFNHLHKNQLVGWISLIILFCSQSSAQETKLIDLLKLNGGKPTLSETGEGVTSFKITDLFQLGVTKISPVKPDFKVQLPIGYTVFNDLIYRMETKAVFSGPTDIELYLPSAKTAESFDKLRILCAEMDYGDPQIPRWTDCTVNKPATFDQQTYLSGIEFEQRLPNLKTRILHAFQEHAPEVFLVARKDSNLARDRFTADLKIIGSDIQSIEGRRVSYTLRVSNLGPDDATNIIFHQVNWMATNSATLFFDRISATSTSGKCHNFGGNIYCKFPKLEKDKTIEVKLVDRCPWLSTEKETRAAWEYVNRLTVQGDERDPSSEDNEVEITATILSDSNKSPVADIVSPRPSQMFRGPKANVPIRVTASDPDGVVSKVEFFENGRPLGVGTLVGPNEYELIYKDVPFGSHDVEIRVTDNQGRDYTTKTLPFIVNGLAELQIISPAAGAKLNKSDDITVTIRARNPTSPLKTVSLEFWDSDASPIGNDLYSLRLRSCGRVCRLRAIAIDAQGVETISEVVEFVIAEAPNVELLWADGEYSKPVENDQKFKVSELILRAVANRGNDPWKRQTSAKIVKVEIFANGELVWSEATDESEVLSEFRWQNIQSGRYKLQVVATDEDGAVGKSPVVTTTIERP